MPRRQLHVSVPTTEGLMPRILIEFINKVVEKYSKCLQTRMCDNKGSVYKGLLNCLEVILRGGFKICGTEEGKVKKKQNL